MVSNDVPKAARGMAALIARVARAGRKRREAFIVNG